MTPGNADPSGVSRTASVSTAGLRLSSIPTAPGVYRFRDSVDRVIYVGKAKNLRSRLTSYFADPTTLHPRTAAMVTTAAALDWTIVGTEVEALQLEYAWIKQFDPRFNVKYRDDKSYPYLAITMSEEFPRVHVTRGPRSRGVRYIGPFSHAWAIRDTLDLLLRVFPVRTCANGTFQRARRDQRRCLLGDIGKCAAPCVGAIEPAAHRRLAEELARFLANGDQSLLDEVRGRMRAAAARQDYELAAALRDDMLALQRVLERNAVVLPGGVDLDLVGIVADELEFAVSIFSVRSGRIRGQRSWIADRVTDDLGRALEGFLVNVYAPGEAADMPREVAVSVLPAAPDDAADRAARLPAAAPEATDAEGPTDAASRAVEVVLAEQRGGPVRLYRPVRGARAELMTTVLANADEALRQHKSRRASDLATRSRALRELQDAIGLAQPLLRIECLDISHLAGEDVVGSLVVFEDGMPTRSEYRTYQIRVRGRGDTASDVASVAELVTRRYAPRPSGDPAVAVGPDADGSADASPEGTGSTPRRFHYDASLLVVDGGQPQVAAAAAALEACGRWDLPVIGLAKRLEEVWLPGDPYPVILPRSSEALYLLQRVRDEAHRVAIRYQRSKRGARRLASQLDGIAGLGPARRSALLTHFGSLAAVKAATAGQIAEVPGIGPVLAATIEAALRSPDDTSGAGAAASAPAAPADPTAG